MKPNKLRKLSLRTETVRPLDASKLAGVAGGMTQLSFTTGCATANCMTLGTFCDTHDCMLTFTSCACY